jgi:hypothetical protein
VIRPAVCLLLAVPVLAAPAPRPVVEVSFDAHPEGPYADALVRDDWPDVKWVGLANRATLVTEKGWAGRRCLQIAYPKGSVGPGEGGGQFLVRLPPRDEYCLDYYVMFREGFDFKDGGKLPGLCGGRCNTGGNVPTGDGWSARYMWQRGARMILYLYHLDQPGKWGDGQVCKGVVFEPGRWYRLTQRIRVNAPDSKDGIAQVWVDGKLVMERSDIRYRNVAGAQVDHFYFSTFHGGSGRHYAPAVDSFACYDHFRIYETAAGVLAHDLRTARRAAAAEPAAPRAAPKPRPKAKPGAVEAWDGRLRLRVREALAAKRRIAFVFSGVGKRTELDALGEDGGLRMRAGGSAFTFSWKVLSLADRCRLAEVLADGGGDGDRAVAAFFLTACGRTASAGAFLRRIPDGEARAVREAFE